MTEKKSNCIVEIFSRVTGFFRPVQTWNKGKSAEFKDRKKFNPDNFVKEQKESND